MDWCTYYERFYDWADSTQVSRISSIDHFGDVSDEVAQIAIDLFDCKAATRLVRRALSYGVRFTAQEIESMVASLDTVPDELILTCKTAFSQEQIDEISFYYDNQSVLDSAKRKSGLERYEEIHIRECNTNVNARVINIQNKHRKPSFGQILGAVGLGLLSGLLGAKNKKHSGRCNGDGTSCPPHYGYRYGRWYYGHGHNYGCTFGGKRGGKS